MDYFYIALIVVAAYLILTRYMNQGIKNISTGDLKGYLTKKDQYQFIDVRTPGEFKNKKIKGFTNMPLDQLVHKSASLSKDKPVVLICQSGARSYRAARTLKGAGYKDLINVRGGMNMWRD